jgi:hypothetical protein
MSVDKMSVDKMPVDKMSYSKRILYFITTKCIQTEIETYTPIDSTHDIDKMPVKRAVDKMSSFKMTLRL